MTAGEISAQRQTQLRPARGRRETEVAPQHSTAGELRPLQTKVGTRAMQQLLGGVRGLIGEGTPLSATLRAEQEHHFGVNLGGVRLHDHAGAHQLAHGQLARAFTQGNDIVFNKRLFRPDTAIGRVASNRGRHGQPGGQELPAFPRQREWRARGGVDPVHADRNQSRCDGNLLPRTSACLGVHRCSAITGTSIGAGAGWHSIRRLDRPVAGALSVHP